VGLPQTELPAALISFNIGVEIGQVLFVLGYLGIVKLLSMKHIGMDADLFSILRRHERPVAFAIAVVSLYWTIERIDYFWL